MTPSEKVDIRHQVESSASGAKMEPDSLARFRKALAATYYDTLSIVRVLQDASIDIRNVKLQGTPNDIWASALSEAERTGRLYDLWRTVNAEYPRVFSDFRPSTPLTPLGMPEPVPLEESTVLPNWLEVFWNFLFRPVYLLDQIQSYSSETHVMPLWRGIELPSARWQRYRNVSSRLAVAIVIDSALVAAFAGLIIKVLSHYFRNVPPLDVEGLAWGWAAGAIGGVVLGNTMGLSVGLVCGFIVGVSIGVRSAEGALLASAIAWGIALGFTISVLPPIAFKRHLPAARGAIVLMIAAVIYYFCARLWNPSSVSKDLILAACVFWGTSFVSFTRLPLYFVVQFLVGLWSVLLGGEMGRTRFVLGIVLRFEHIYWPIRGVKNAVRVMYERSVSATEDKRTETFSDFEEILCACLCSPGHREIALEMLRIDPGLLQRSERLLRLTREP